MGFQVLMVRYDLKKLTGFPISYSTNPYDPPTAETARSEDARPKKWAIRYLWIFGVAGVLPPLPLFYWVFDGEPFVGPWYVRDVVFCSLSAVVSVGWFIWLVIHVVAIWKGWIHKMTVVLWAIPILFGPLCLLVCYLYLHDRRVL